MTEGIIIKALSGFYYVKTNEGILECKARGRFRLDGTSPLVGDRVSCSIDNQGHGRIDHVEERKNWFIRPAVANVDALAFVAANTSRLATGAKVTAITAARATAPAFLRKVFFISSFSFRKTINVSILVLM